MALRQREWAIMIRPYYTHRSVRVNYEGVAKAADSDVLIERPRGYAVNLKGSGEGGGVPSENSGSWVVWYQDTSFKRLREKYKELLKETTVEHIRVVEVINVDTLITPIS